MLGTDDVLVVLVPLAVVILVAGGLRGRRSWGRTFGLIVLAVYAVGVVPQERGGIGRASWHRFAWRALERTRKRKRPEVRNSNSEPVLGPRICAGDQGRGRTADTTMLRYEV